MKANRLILSGLKALVCMSLIFVLGFLGYHNPDSMVWVIAAAIFCALAYYFYSKGLDE
ncbi:MAG TPA: hypothetical protein VFE04_10045 [Puia sp.]|nr:hypothetical protein [Puia sp.]